MTIDFQYIAYGLIAVIFGWIIYDIKDLKASSKDHEKRIQKVEDLHGRDIEEIKRILTELSSEVKALNTYIHRDNNDLVNFIKQQGDMIKLLHNHLSDIVSK